VGDGGANKGIEFFVAADSELEVARCDTLDLEILGGIACQLENLSCQILQDGGNVDSSLGANAHFALGVLLEETLDTTTGELQTSALGMAHLLLGTLGTGLATRALAARGLALTARHVDEFVEDRVGKNSG